MAHLIDLVLCIFPFEVDLYRQAGLRALFVGHPMIERLRAQKSESERDPNLIGLFPGSRSREVRKVFPVMLETARELQKHNQNLRFEVAAASEALAREMNPAVARFGKSHEQSAIEIKVGETAAIMQRAWAGIIASGSATLEAAYFRLPFVLIYKVAWPTYFAARLVVNVKYLGMPNLLADTEIVPEFIQYDAKPSAIVKAMQPLIEDADAREGMIAQFDTIVSKLQAAVVSSPPGRSGQRSTLVGSGASETAARAIIEEIEDRGERI
jgi:lipid-A-disaccharide synthase